VLLEVDAEYRRRAAANELPKLAPRRFNPRHEAWLPILRTERQGWSMTVLFSNTARAHELGKIHDWVVIYYQKEGPEAQGTVVTETQGLLQGKRVIRGRERECADFYRAHQAAKV
jgi:putative hydrolase